MNDTFWMKKAIQCAQKASQQGEVPVGAVLVKDNTLISEGWNQPISLNDPSAHAEIIVLRKGGEALGNYRLVNTTLYVTLEPCVMCVGAILHARVARLVYGAKDFKAGAISSFCDLKDLSHNHSIEVRGGVLGETCGKLLTTFFQVSRAQKNMDLPL